MAKKPPKLGLKSKPKEEHPYLFDTTKSIVNVTKTTIKEPGSLRKKLPERKAHFDIKETLDIFNMLIQILAEKRRKIKILREQLNIDTQRLARIDWQDKQEVQQDIKYLEEELAKEKEIYPEEYRDIFEILELLFTKNSAFLNEYINYKRLRPESSFAIAFTAIRDKLKKRYPDSNDYKLIQKLEQLGFTFYDFK